MIVTVTEFITSKIVKGSNSSLSLKHRTEKIHRTEKKVTLAAVWRICWRRAERLRDQKTNYSNYAGWS